MRRRYLFLFLIPLAMLVGWGPVFKSNEPLPQTALSWVGQEISTLNTQASNLDPLVLKRSLEAYVNARHKGLDRKGLLTIIDYSKPSNERRLWVLDLNTNKILFNTWVSHGKNSGQVNATSFSNQPGSLKSSIGVFETEQTYMGGKGLSLRLNGLEKGVNDNALRRDIVIHGAWYVQPSLIHQYAHVGRSWGCPALSPKLVGPIINTIKNNTLVVVYYPDQKWLKSSSFLATV